MESLTPSNVYIYYLYIKLNKTSFEHLFKGKTSIFFFLVLQNKYLVIILKFFLNHFSVHLKVEL